MTEQERAYWTRPAGHGWFPAKVGNVYRVRFHPSGEDAKTETGRVRWSRTYAGALEVCEEVSGRDNDEAVAALYAGRKVSP